MARINVTLPAKLKSQIDRRVASGEYASADQYVRELLQRDQKRQGQLALEQLLLRRLDQGDSVGMDAADFDQIRRRVHRRITSARRI